VGQEGVISAMSWCNCRLDARYAANLLEEAVQAPVSKTLSRHQLEKTLQELAQFSHQIPLLPDNAFSRESLYRDHD